MKNAPSAFVAQAQLRYRCFPSLRSRNELRMDAQAQMCPSFLCGSRGNLGENGSHPMSVPIQLRCCRTAPSRPHALEKHPTTSPAAARTAGDSSSTLARIQWPRRSQTPLASSTCRVTSGNGLRTPIMPTTAGRHRTVPSGVKLSPGLALCLSTARGWERTGGRTARHIGGRGGPVPSSQEAAGQQNVRYLCDVDVASVAKRRSRWALFRDLLGTGEVPAHPLSCRRVIPDRAPSTAMP